jgi:hypothetical protein
LLWNNINITIWVCFGKPWHCTVEFLSICLFL